MKQQAPAPFPSLPSDTFASGLSDESLAIALRELHDSENGKPYRIDGIVYRLGQEVHTLTGRVMTTGLAHTAAKTAILTEAAIRWLMLREAVPQECPSASTPYATFKDGAELAAYQRITVESFLNVLDFQGADPSELPSPRQLSYLRTLARNWGKS